MISGKTLIQKFTAVVCSFTCLCCFGQLKINTSFGPHVKLQFKNYVGTEPLVQGKNYTNSFGETYSVLKFRYYITQIQFVDSSDMKVQFFPDDYYLVDAYDSSLRELDLPLSVKHISYISFMIGVDSAANVSGTQQGALDPVNGMFWTWNTGYVMAKLQGVSPQAKSPAHGFTFDAGGFKTGENTMRKIELAVNTPKNKEKVIHNVVIKCDINKWFDGTHPVKIAEHPGCHEPGALAMQIADNYATMFSLEKASR